jgi:hypothetical protein
MKPWHRSVACSVVAIGLCSSATGAAEPAAEATAESAAATPRHWAVEWNPLAAALFRASANLELSPSTHHAFTLSPIVQLDTGDIGTGIWGELGYRYYSGAGGLEGFFVGPSLVLGSFNYATDARPDKQHGSAAGIAIDAGYQFAFRSGLVLGLGLGAQYQQIKKSFAVRNDPVNEATIETGVLPRILFTVGYAH